MRIHIPKVTVRSGGWLWIETGAAGLRALSSELNCIHALAWRQLSPEDRNDKWSRTILDFKNGDDKALEVVTSLLVERLPCLLDDLDLPQLQPVNLVTALSAEDTEANPNRPLFKLVSSMAARMGGRFHFRRWLLKKRHHQKIFPLSPEARVDTVHGKYTVETEARDKFYVEMRRIDNCVFLILDDFVTSGATLAEISRALHGAYPGASIHAAALAKHVYSDVLKSVGYATFNNHDRLGECPGC